MRVVETVELSLDSDRIAFITKPDRAALCVQLVVALFCECIEYYGSRIIRGDFIKLGSELPVAAVYIICIKQQSVGRAIAEFIQKYALRQIEHRAIDRAVKAEYFFRWSDGVGSRDDKFAAAKPDNIAVAEIREVEVAAVNTANSIRLTRAKQYTAVHIFANLSAVGNVAVGSAAVGRDEHMIQVVGNSHNQRVEPTEPRRLEHRPAVIIGVAVAQCIQLGDRARRGFERNHSGAYPREPIKAAARFDRGDELAAESRARLGVERRCVGFDAVRILEAVVRLYHIIGELRILICQRDREVAYRGDEHEQYHRARLCERHRGVFFAIARDRAAGQPQGCGRAAAFAAEITAVACEVG